MTAEHDSTRSLRATMRGTLDAYAPSTQQVAEVSPLLGPPELPGTADGQDHLHTDEVHRIPVARKADDHAAYTAAWTQYDVPRTQQPTLATGLRATTGAGAGVDVGKQATAERAHEAELAAGAAYDEWFRATASVSAIAEREQQFQRAERDLYAAIDNDDPAGVTAALERVDQAWWLRPDSEIAATRPSSSVDQLDAIAAVVRDRNELAPLIRASLGFHTAHSTAQAVHATDPAAHQWWREFTDELREAALVVDDMVGVAAVDPARNATRSLPDSPQLRHAINGLVGAAGAALAEQRRTATAEPAATSPGVATGRTAAGLRLSRPTPPQDGDLVTDGPPAPLSPAHNPGPQRP
jgi:hypothetical protein